MPSTGHVAIYCLLVLLMGGAITMCMGPARAQSGMHGEGHAQMHQWYRTLTDRHGYSCCNESDCRPTVMCETASGRPGVRADGRCVSIPSETLLHVSPPDGRSHVCMSRGADEPRCVILGEPRS